MKTHFRNVWQDTISSTRLSLLEVVIVALLLIVIQVSVFHGYYTGSASPGGDFLGIYSNEPFAWWRDGGLLSPPDWMPYMWGGYPAVASIQNSAWYLPTGLATLFGFDIHASASLQAIHVAFAGLGVYVLGRRANLGRVASSFGLVAYSFTSGFFSNSPYVDIVRGHAFAPWILLCLSPLWPWKRVWGVPVAALILWQAAVGVYPGMLVAFLYAGGTWALAWQWGRKPALRQFALPALTAAIIAALLAMPKYLPLLVLKTFEPAGVDDLTKLTRSSFGAFLLPTFSGLSGTYTLNSFFIPAAAILLVAMASFRSLLMKASLAATLVATVLSVSQIPGHGLLNALPGLGASRFPINDFRPFVILFVVIGGMSGIARLRGGDFVRMRRRSLWTRLSLVLLTPVAAGLFVVVGRFDEADWVPVGVALGLSTVLVAGIALAASRDRVRGVARIVVPVLVIGLTAASGFAYIRTATGVWSVDTIAQQEALWGATSSELIGHRVDLSGSGQRPARSTIPEVAISPEFNQSALNASFYTGVLSTGGYMNVHMSSSFVEARRALADAATANAEAALLSAPGIVIGSTGGLPTEDQIETCVETGQCNGVAIKPLRFAPGNLLYDVTADAPTTVLVNDAYYIGWSALALDEYGRAVRLEARQGAGGVVAVDLPEGSWRLSLVYQTPLGALAGFLGMVGLALLASVSIVPAVRRGKSSTRTACLDVR